MVSCHKYLVDVVELSSSLRLAVKLLYPHSHCSHWFIYNSNLLTHSVCGGVSHMLATIIGGQVHMLALSHFTHSQSHLFIHSTKCSHILRLTHSPSHSWHWPSHSCAGGVTHSTNQALTHRVTQTFNQFALAECDILRESRTLSETWRSLWDGSGQWCWCVMHRGLFTNLLLTFLCAQFCVYLPIVYSLAGCVCCCFLSIL